MRIASVLAKSYARKDHSNYSGSERSDELNHLERGLSPAEIRRVDGWNFLVPLGLDNRNRLVLLLKDPPVTMSESKDAIEALLLVHVFRKLQSLEGSRFVLFYCASSPEYLNDDTYAFVEKIWGRIPTDMANSLDCAYMIFQSRLARCARRAFAWCFSFQISRAAPLFIIVYRGRQGQSWGNCLVPPSRLLEKD